MPNTNKDLRPSSGPDLTIAIAGLGVVGAETARQLVQAADRLSARAGRCLRQHAGVLPFECEPEERLQRLAIPVNWYEPASWAAFAHDCAA